MTRPNILRFATRCVHGGQSPDPTTGAVMMPIYATSTYAQESPGVHKGYDYARVAEASPWKALPGRYTRFATFDGLAPSERSGSNGPALSEPRESKRRESKG